MTARDSAVGGLAELASVVWFPGGAASHERYRSEEHMSELPSHLILVFRLLLETDRKSTRLHSSHALISYAVF